MSQPQPRWPRAGLRRHQGSAMGLDRGGFLFKVLSAGMSDFGKTCRSTSIIWTSCLPQLQTFPSCSLYSHFRPTPDLHGQPANVRSAATSDVLVVQSVLTLSANSCHTRVSYERQVHTVVGHSITIINPQQHGSQHDGGTGRGSEVRFTWGLGTSAAARRAMKC